MNQTSIKRGFTLIELLVVVAIIGILTAIISANFAQAKAKARDAKRISDLSQIQLALELAFDKCQVYPSALTDTDACPGYPMTTFISVVPRDTYRNRDYYYGTDTNKYDYRLGAELENLGSLPGQNPSSLYNVTCTGGTFYCVSPK